MTPPWKFDSEFDRPSGELVLRRLSPQPYQDDCDDHMHSGGNGAPSLLLTYPIRRATGDAVTRGPPSITITAPEPRVGNGTQLVIPKAPGIRMCPEIDTPTSARNTEVVATRSIAHAMSDSLTPSSSSHAVSLLTELKCSLSTVLAREERGYELLCSNVPGMDEVVLTPGNSIVGSPTNGHPESCSDMGRRLLNPRVPGDVSYSGKYSRAWARKRASMTPLSPTLLSQDRRPSSPGLSSGASRNPPAREITGLLDGSGGNWEALSTLAIDHGQIQDTVCGIDCADDSSLPGTPRSWASSDTEDAPLIPGSPLESTLENWYKSYHSRGLGLFEKTEEDESDDDFLYMAPTKTLKQKFERRDSSAPLQTTGLIRQLLEQAPGAGQQQKSSGQDESYDGTFDQGNADTPPGEETENPNLPEQSIYAFRTGPVGYYNGSEITIPMVRDPQLLAGLMGDEVHGLAGDAGPLGRRPMAIFEMTRSRRLFDREVSEVRLGGP